jgi:hypothetical protein
LRKNLRLTTIAYCSIALLALAMLLWQVISTRAGQISNGDPPVPGSIDSSDWNDYIWPVEGCRTRTSDFGEFRATHFHAGIDLSTNQQIGVPIRAPRDGWLYSAYFDIGGYGVFMALQHNDGYITTYGHLSRYSDKVQEALELKLVQLGKSFGYAQWQKREVPVKKGEIVAYSGKTGAGQVPHLHFELRDSTYAAVNPGMAPALRTVDNIPPKFIAIRYVPLDPLSTVNGVNEALQCNAVQVGPKDYRVSQVPVLTGRIGMTVRTIDKAQESRDENAAAKLELAIDNRWHFITMIRKIPAALGWLFRTDREDEMLRSMKGEFRKLYKDPGNLLPAYWPDTAEAGVISLPALKTGKRKAVIIAEDFNGNASRLDCAFTLADPPVVDASISNNSQLRIVTDPPGVSKIRISTVEGSGRWAQLAEIDGGRTNGPVVWNIPPQRSSVLKIVAVDAYGTASPPRYLYPSPGSKQGTIAVKRKTQGDWIVWSITSTVPLNAPPELTLTSAGVERRANVSAITPTQYRAVIRVEEPFSGEAAVLVKAQCGPAMREWRETFDATLIDPVRGGRVESKSGRFSIEFARGDVPRPILVSVSSSDSGGFSVQPQDVALTGTPVIRYRTGAGQSAGLRIAGFHPYARIRVRPVENGKQETGVISASCDKYLANYRLVRDNAPPVVAMGQGRDAITIHVKDALSGIDMQSMQVRVNGKLEAVSYSEGPGCFILSKSKVPVGATVTVNVRDLAGNNAASSLTAGGTRGTGAGAVRKHRR